MCVTGALSFVLVITGCYNNQVRVFVSKIKDFFAKESNILLVLVILFHVSINVLWQRLNTAAPTWDSAGHLALSFLFSDRFVPLIRGVFPLTEFIRISNYYPPFVHLVGGLVIFIFGRNYEIPLLLVGTGFFVLAIIYFYAILKRFFPENDRLVTLAVLVFSFFPGVWEQSRQFHLDVPLLALLLGAFYHLNKSDSLKNSKHTLIFFVFFTLAQLTKWYGFVYLTVPFIYFVIAPIAKSKEYFDKRRIINVLIGSAMVLLVAAPWYVLNLETIKANVAVAATADAGDPVETLSYESIFHYLKLMTSHQIGIVSVILIFTALFFTFRRNDPYSRFVLYSVLVPYIIFTLIQNKDLRYILPLTPFFAYYISYILTVGSSKQGFVKSGLFAIYQLIIFLFFSFNQLNIVPEVWKFVPFLYAGPGYMQSWVVEPYAYSYNPNDWRGNEIIDTVNTLADKEQIHGPYKLLELSDNRFYSIASFDMFKLQNAFYYMELEVPYNRADPLSPEELSTYLSKVYFALVPVDPGPPGLRNIAVLRQLIDYFRSDQNRDFTLVAQFNMPDGNRVDLYKRTNLATFVNPALNRVHLDIYVADILFIDRKLLGNRAFNIVLTDYGDKEIVVSYPEMWGDQKRIPLEGIKSFRIEVPADQHNILDIRGWIFKDSIFIRDPKYQKIVEASTNQFVYRNYALLPRTAASTFNTSTDVKVSYLGDKIEVNLTNPSQAVFVAYATTGWQWNSVTLNNQNRDLTIPIEGLIQLEVSQKSILIQGFTSNWGFFRCYNGNAICFYPITAGL